MRVVVEVGDWEHECCGPAYERNSSLRITCLVVPGSDTSSPRYVECHHHMESEHETVEVTGRVDELHIRHPDGATEAIHRLPSGRALRGFDDRDDGHLERPWTGELVTNDSDQFLLTIVS